MAPKLVIGVGAGALGALLFLCPRIFNKRKSLKEVMIKGAVWTRATTC